MADLDIAPQFGAELKDGFKSVNAWVGGGIAWLEDIKEFYRERSEIEKEYSSKLSTLAKKYYEKKAKKSSSLSVGDTPTVTPGSLESASMTTWGVQLSTLEQRAAEHDRFSKDLSFQLVEPVNRLQERCEQLRKQHSDYAAKLEKERDGQYGELKKDKVKYDEVCETVEKRRKKIESSFDSGKSKAQNAYQQHQQDMYNAKNIYLISINVTNKQKERYYHEYVPDLLDSLQDLSESRVTKLNSIWLQAAAIEKGTLDRSTQLVQHLSGEIPRNNPVLDSMMFVRHNAAEWRQPTDFKFEPSPVMYDDDTMSTNGPSKVFLQNILGKSKGALSSLRGEVDNRRREVEAGKQVKQNVRLGKDKRDDIDVSRSVFIALENFHDTERRKITAEVEVSTILQAVGDVTLGAVNHAFEAKTFKIPTNCDLCAERIWGLSAKGFACQSCGYTCHSKCQLKVPADCPGELDKETRRGMKATRQAQAHTVQPIEENVPSGRPMSTSPPRLTRTETMGSMNTLSSGYAASAQRSVSGMSVPTVEDPDVNKALPVRSTTSARPRIVAPPPDSWANGSTPKSSEKRGKMTYAYQQNAAGEISVAEGKEVVIVEADDGSGWTKVRSGNDTGFIPSSYFTPISPSSAYTAPLTSPFDEPAAENGRPLSSSSSLAGSIAAGIKKKGPAVAPRRGAKKIRHVEVLYSYEARGETELSISEGERLVLVKEDGGDGWAEVEKAGRLGSVPAAYVKEV